MIDRSCPISSINISKMVIINEWWVATGSQNLASVLKAYIICNVNQFYSNFLQRIFKVMDDLRIFLPKLTIQYRLDPWLDYVWNIMHFSRVEAVNIQLKLCDCHFNSHINELFHERSKLVNLIPYGWIVFRRKGWRFRLASDNAIFPVPNPSVDWKKTFWLVLFNIILEKDRELFVHLSLCWLTYSLI